MSLFLLFSMPVAWLFLVTAWFRRENSGTNAGMFVRGLLFFLPSAFIWWFIFGIMPVVPGSILYLFKPWFNDFFFFPLAGTAGFALFSNHEGMEPQRLEKRISFLMGVLCLSGLVTYIEGIPSPDFYPMLILPLLRIAFALVLAILVDSAADEAGFPMIMRYGAAFLWTFACAAVALLFHLSQPLFGLLLAFTEISGSGFLFSRTTKQRTI